MPKPGKIDVSYLRKHLVSFLMKLRAQTNNFLLASLYKLLDAYSFLHNPVSEKYSDNIAYITNKVVLNKLVVHPFTFHFGPPLFAML